MKVSLFVTCMVDLFHPETGEAVVDVLRACGDEVSFPLGQTCCGQPAWNSGFADDAAKVARNSLDALSADGTDAVVVPAGSCATMIKVFWPELFEVVGDHSSAQKARSLGAKTFEFSSYVANAIADGRLSTPASPAEVPTAYHHSCHMLRELRIEAAPETVAQAAGCSLVEWPDAQRCCGFGGLFSVKLPETSVAMADEKLASLPPQAEMLVGSDASCLMHLWGRAQSTGRELPVRHLAEVLAASMRRNANETQPAS